MNNNTINREAEILCLQKTVDAKRQKAGELMAEVCTLNERIWTLENQNKQEAEMAFFA